MFGLSLCHVLIELMPCLDYVMIKMLCDAMFAVAMLEVNLIYHVVAMLVDAMLLV